MAYSPQLYIRPAALTDLTITLTRNDEVIETWTLNDFVLVNNSYWQGDVLVNDPYWQGTITYETRYDIITIESTGYQTQTIEIHWLTDYNITLSPVEFSNIETNSIKYYCKDVVARDSITDIETTLAEKVNVSGDTMTGNLVVSTDYWDNWNIALKNTNQILSSIPSSNTYTALVFTDNNNDALGRVLLRDTTTCRETCLRVDGYDGASNANIKIGFDNNNEAFTYAPACDNNNSIVTTVSHKYSSNNNTINAIKFGNGLIINWGRVSLNGVISSSNKVITFAIPYTTNAKVVAGRNANAGQTTPVVVGWEGTTSFTIGCPSGSSSTGYVNFIAIGY